MNILYISSSNMKSGDEEVKIEKESLDKTILKTESKLIKTNPSEEFNE